MSSRIPVSHGMRDLILQGGRTASGTRLAACGAGHRTQVLQVVQVSYNEDLAESSSLGIELNLEPRTLNLNYAKRFTFNFHLQIGVNPSRVAPGMGHYSPGAVPGLLDGDTFGVSNRKITSVLRVSLPIATCQMTMMP